MSVFFSRYKYIIIAVVVLAAGATSYIILGKSTQTIVSPGTSVAATPTPTMELTTWNDEAGFSFQYPKELAVNKHEEDNANYAHVELTNNNHPGKVIVWLMDLPKGVATLADWVKLSQFAGATTLDTTLVGQPAKKVLATAPVKTLSVGSITDDNLLFNIEATLTDNDYWQRVHDTIVSSFSFSNAAQTVQPSAGGEGGGDVDEEEVVQ